MFSWRTKRQFIAILIIVVIVGVIALFNVRKFMSVPTCFDNKQNHGETGIDCGGPCAACELRNPKPVAIFWVRSVLVRPDTYDVAAYVQNPNEVLSSANLEYEFTLFDALGEIARRTGKTFIFPQESFYIVEPNLKTSRQPTRVEFKITQTDWQLQPTDRPSLVIEKRDYKVIEESGKKQSAIEAVLLNRSFFDLREVEVSFLILDKSGNLLGINKTIVDNLKAGSRNNIRSTWPEELKGEVGAIEVDPRINIFDPTAIIKPR